MELDLEIGINIKDEAERERVSEKVFHFSFAF
jgi:hypothetical protein